MESFIAITAIAGLALLPLTLASYAAYYLISLPLRRQERGRILIDLLEVKAASSSSQSLAEAIRQFSTIEDPSLGVRFHILAAHLEQGLTFSEAIRHVPRLLPRTVQSMLSTAEAIGNYRKILPACQGVLNDAANTVHAASRNYLLLLFILLPTTGVMFLLHIIFWPKFIMILRDYAPNATTPLPTIVTTAADIFPFLLIGISICAVGLIVSAIAYIGGYRLQRWIERGLSPVTDRVAWFIPWRRARIQRNFSMMLGILLDEGIPETDAIPLAAAAAGNQHFVRRSRRCLIALQQGQSLIKALQYLDPTAEFSWRMRLAMKHEGGFRNALRGWWKWLDVRASRQEQIAAQTISTGLVLTNGLATGLIAYSVIYGLTHIINQATLW